MNQHIFVPSQDYGDKRKVCKYCGIFEDYSNHPCLGKKARLKEAIYLIQDSRKILKPIDDINLVSINRMLEHIELDLIEILSRG